MSGEISLVTVDPGTGRKDGCGEEGTGLSFFSGRGPSAKLEKTFILRAKGAVQERVPIIVAQVLSEIRRHCFGGRYDLVIEYPIIRKYEPAASDDILVLVLIVGGIMCGVHGGAHGGVHGAKSTLLIRPEKWKGTLDKEVFAGRILKHLRPEERALLAAIKDNGNAIDSTGMGLWVNGRL